MKCIYCLIDQPKSAYRKREHVMPQCFGKFQPNNLILRDIVCDNCNQYFGEKIEIALGRDSIEGIMRYKFGIKPHKIPKTHKRLTFKIPSGPLKGIIVIPTCSKVKGEIEDIPALQVGFLKKSKNEFDYFEPRDIPSVDELKKNDYDIREEKIFAIFEGKKELEYLRKVLKERGVDFKEVVEMDWPEEVKNKSQILITGTVRMDQTIMRGFSKIVFNYSAYILGKEFVLRDDFDAIRKFIRYGEGKDKDFFLPNQPPILHDDRMLKKFGAKVTNGHILVFGWEKGMDLHGLLSIFNFNTYLVKLCHNFTGVWRPVKSGHHFDIKTKEINRVMSLPKQLLPYR
ncbi:MAG: HNH endonuclease [Candidatus Omnitrophica bacterium]|nr:HNH endonuclease [Candidatus Omnitrophota bacterium]